MSIFRYQKRPLPPIALVFSAVAKELKSFDLKPVKKLHAKFDPFHDGVESIRWFLFHISNRKIQATNPNCTVKTEVVNDRSEPSLTFFLNNNKKVIFKTANFNQVELLQLYQKYIGVKEESEAPEEPTNK